MEARRAHFLEEHRTNDWVVNAQLNRTLPELDIDRESFKDIIEFFRDVSGSNIEINWDLVKAGGIEPATPASMKVRNISFAKALDTLLNQLSTPRTRLITARGVEMLVIEPVDAAIFERESHQENGASRRVAVQLERTLPNAKFNSERLVDAIGFLSKAAGTSIYVDWNYLRYVGVTRDTPVTLDLKNVTIARTLSLVLNLIGENGSELDYTIDRGILTIGAYSGYPHERIYDVRDLVQGFSRQSAAARLEAIVGLLSSRLPAEFQGDEIRASEGLVTVTRPETAQHRALILLQQLRAILKPGEPPTEQKLWYPSTGGGSWISGAAPSPIYADNSPLGESLRRQLTRIQFRAARLVDVMDDLHKTSGLEMDVNWTALERLGISRDTPVTLDLKDVTCSRFLTILCDLVATEAGRVIYTINKNSISITTREDIAGNAVTRTYDIHDLLQGLGKHHAEAREQALIKAILSIDPNSWRENGGQASTVRALEGSLIITQTPETHEHVHALIEHLRSVINPGVAAPDKNAFPLAPAK